MSMMLMVKAMNTKVGNPLRKLVLIKLADNANDHGECWPSHQHVADQCEISKTSVRNHIKKLEEMGLLRIEHREGPKGNTSNLYHLTLQGMPADGTGIAGNGIGGIAGDDTRTSHSFEPVKEPTNHQFDYELVAEIWNRSCDESNTPSKKCRVVSEATKKNMPFTYKKHCAIRRAGGHEPLDRVKFCESYFPAVLNWGSGFVGKPGQHESWKMNLEHASKVGTYDKVAEFLAND